MQPNLLAQLRDIHLPKAPGFWPPSSNFYLFIAGVVLIMALLILITVMTMRYWHAVKLRRNRRKYAIAQLDKLFAKREFAQLSALIKKIAIVTHPQEQIASLNGIGWLNFLDKTGNTDAFSHGVGKLLLTMPYKNHEPSKQQQKESELHLLLKKWVKLVL